MWGKFIKPWPMREKYPCVFFYFFYPTTSIEEWLLVVEAVNGLWEWGGRTISPHPHAHSTMVDFTMEETTILTHAGIPLFPRRAERSCTSNSCPLCRLFVLTQGPYSVHYPRAQVFFCFGLTQRAGGCAFSSTVSL